MHKSRTDFLVEFIFESDAIEEIRDDRGVLRREIEENKTDGHVGAMLMLESLAQDKVQILNEALVCRVQGLITAGQLNPKYVGCYRNVNIFIGGRMGYSPKAVPRAMHDLVRGIATWQRKYLLNDSIENIKRIADFHYKFEIIHPFADGNGRTGRALVYYLFRYIGIEPFVFTSADKRSDYYPCFGKWKKYELMHRYFFKKLG